MDKKNIEDIYPLTPMQQALLLHHLQLGKSDGGFLQMSFFLHGNLDVSQLKRSWQFTVERHPVLRTAVYWEDLDKPLQVVYRLVSLPWEYQDWRQLSPEEHNEKLEAFFKGDRENGLQLSQAPVMRLTLFQFSENAYQFTWSCHHLLLDGWSGALVLKEVFDYYEALTQRQDYHIERPLPYRSYIIWLQKQDLVKAKSFWYDSLKNFSIPPPLSGNNLQKSSSDGQVYDEQQFRLSQGSTEEVQLFVQQNRITLNILIQGVWALVFSKSIHQEDIIIGTTVSGRPSELPGVDSMVGLFTNTLPFRMKISGRRQVISWLRDLQTQQVEMCQYEHSPLAQILEWSGLPGHPSLFESIVVFENYPWTSFLKEGNTTLEIRNFRGGITTNYPLTLIVKPNHEFSIQLIYDSYRFNKNLIQAILKCLQALINRIVSNPEQSLSELQQFLVEREQVDSINLMETHTENRQDTTQRNPQHEKISAIKSENYVAPRDSLEQELGEIWQQVLGVEPISIDANFFDLGGNSLLVVTLIEQVEKKLGHTVPLVTLFQAPTLEQFAHILRQKQSLIQTSHIVSIQPKGPKPPLFFYGVRPSHNLAHYMGPEQPIYGLAPQDLKGKQTSKTIFKEMASLYISEILNHFPDGPYALGGHCWAGMLAYEMAQQLHKLGKTVTIVILVGTTFKIPNKIYLSYLLRRRISEHARNLLQLQPKEKLNYIRDDLARGVRDKILSLTRRIHQLKNKTSNTYASAKLARFDATGNYEPLPYPGRVVVFYGEENPIKHKDDPRYLTWRQFVKGDLDIQNSAGKYGGILEEPHVSLLAKQIEVCLDTALPMERKTRIG